MSLPPNIHISSHPCLQAKLSQLRSHSTNPRETRDLVHEIASILAVEAFADGLSLTTTGKVCITARRTDKELCLVGKGWRIEGS